MTILRKATDKVVARSVPADSLELVLSVLPRGVYGVENDDGIEVAVATVKSGRVTFAGAVPVATNCAGGSNGSNAP